ncbi:MAG: glycosyltransferase [Muribaculaceae bacterium]|nr:glycosyltransferase [Muribaculaceae bacterium]MCM1398939.1 glycosyltransferase [Clostridium sp.]MCM1458797.1 glycosyltransferase [Bacteroides sp.]
MEKYISVIIPCYNAVSYLNRCVDSLLAQTIGYEHLELIFVNDASTDNTLDVLLGYEKKYEENIIVINCEKNGRQGAARNIGMKYAGCDYIAFLDADDFIHPEMYEKLYNKAVECNLDVAGCHSMKVMCGNDAKSPLKADGVYHDIYYMADSTETRRNLIENWNMDGIWANIYRKEIIFNYDIWFPEGVMYEDNYWSELLKFYINRVYVLDEVMHYYFVHQQSTTGSYNSKWHFDRLAVEELLLCEYKKRDIYNTYCEYIIRSFLERYYFNSLFIFFTRFGEVPIEVFRKMTATIRKRIPDYKRYIKENGVNEILAQLIEVDLTQEELNQIQSAYIEQFGLS